MLKPIRNGGFASFAAAIFIVPSFFAPFWTNAASPNAPNAPTGAGSSLNWAGYEATGGTYTSVGASWDIPQSSAPTGVGINTLSADATWVGIGGVSSSDLIQAGTQTVFQNGTPSYEAWYETLPAGSQQVPLTVHPGDAMTVSITEQSAGQWNISFYDATTDQRYTTSVPYQSSFSSAEWIEEMPSAPNGFVALDNFGTVSFTNGFTVENGTQLTLAGADAQPLTMINSADQALSTPSSLGADGASFTVTRTNANVSATAIAPTIIVSHGGYGGGNGTSSTRGRWTRTGVGVQGYTPPTQTERDDGAHANNTTDSGLGYFRIGFKFGNNLPSFLRTFEDNVRSGWSNR